MARLHHLVQKLGDERPGRDEEWHIRLAVVKLAHALLDRDRETFTRQTVALRQGEDGPELLDDLIFSLNSTRVELMDCWSACEWVLCRLSIVLDRNVLDDPPA